MAATKRNASSTALGAVKGFAAAARMIKPTRPLADAEQRNFEGIIASKETAAWSPFDIAMATLLAVFTARLNEISEVLALEDMTQRNDKGNLISNPLLTAAMQISSTVQSMSRTLGLSASQRGQTGAPQSKKNAADAKAREAISRAEETDLV